MQITRTIMRAVEIYFKIGNNKIVKQNHLIIMFKYKNILLEFLKLIKSFLFIGLI